MHKTEILNEIVCIKHRIKAVRRITGKKKDINIEMHCERLGVLTGMLNSSKLTSAGKA